jgi:drug/metabolite transporter (DMT)-like permease
MQKKAGTKDYLALHLAIIIFSLCGIASKTAAMKEFMSLSFFLWYGLDILCLGIYAVIWQQVLKKISLTTAFCNKAVSITWSMLWGCLIFKETITLQNLIGAVIVIIGVIIVVTTNE